jgi:hypothetical protein
MSKMKAQPVILASVLVASPICEAADDEGRFNVLGPGTDSCEDLLQAANPGDDPSPWTDYNIYTAYAAGYLTGYNEFVDETVDIRGQHKMLEVMAMVEEFCRDHPDADVHAGLKHAIEVLAPYRERRRALF